MENIGKKKETLTSQTSTEDKGYEVKYANEEDIDIEHDIAEYKTIKILTQNLWVHYLAPSPCKRDRIKAFIQFLSEK